MADDLEPDVGTQVRLLREAAGLSQGQLAEMAATNQQTVQRIEAGKTENSKATPKLLAVLKSIELRTEASHSDIIRAYMTQLDTQNIKKEIRRKQSSIEDGVERITLGNNYILNFSSEIEPGLILIRPDRQTNFKLPDLAPQPDRMIALYVPTSDMEPEYEPGDIIFADTMSPPIPNVSCIFHNNASESKIATIKRLVSSTKDDWHVKSWSPNKDITLSKSDWPVCVRIVGKFSRR